MANFPDGFSEINRALVDGDDVFVGNRRAQLSRFWTYIQSKLSAGAVTVGSLVTSGTVDGRDVSTDGATLDGLASGAALSVKGNATNATAAVADIAAASDGHVLRRSGTAIGFGTIATAGIADGAVTGAKIAQSGTLDIGAASITTTGEIASALLKSGAGSPEGVTTAGVGAVYRDTTNGLIYVKRSGSGNTGWRALADLASTDPLSVFPSYGLARGLWTGAGCTDYVDAAASTNGVFTRHSSGTGATSTALNSEAGAPGIMSFTTGTDTTGRCASATSAAAFTTTDGVLRWRGRFRIPTASDGTNTFALECGFFASLTSVTAPARAAYFRYQHSVNSGLLEAVCRNASSEAGSVFSTTIDPVITSGFLDLEVELDQPNNTAKFVSNGVLLTTISANVPSGLIGGGINIIKSAGTTGRTFEADGQIIYQGGLSR